MTLDNYNPALAIAITTLTAISLAALSLVLGIYMLNVKIISSFALRLKSFYLCLACFFQNLAQLIMNPIFTYSIYSDSSDDVGSLCITSGVLKVWLDLASIIWTTLILLSVYLSLAGRHKIHRLQPLYICIGFVLPLAAACVPIFINGYGYTNYFCWFVSQQSALGYWLRMGYFLIPIWTLFAINMLLAIGSYWRLRVLGLPAQNLHIFKRVLLFPGILAMVAVCPSISIFSSEQQQQYRQGLEYASYIVQSLYGLFNAIAYGFNPAMRQQLREWVWARGSAGLRGSEESRGTVALEAELAEMTRRR